MLPQNDLYPGIVKGIFKLPQTQLIKKVKVYKIRDNIEIPLQSLPVSLPEEADVWERLLEVSELLIHELTLLVHMDVVIVMGTVNVPQESLHLPHSFACK